MVSRVKKYRTGLVRPTNRMGSKSTRVHLENSYVGFYRGSTTRCMAIRTLEYSLFWSGDVMGPVEVLCCFGGGVGVGVGVGDGDGDGDGDG